MFIVFIFSINLIVLTLFTIYTLEEEKKGY
jgi:hypothetical protein